MSLNPDQFSQSEDFSESQIAEMKAAGLRGVVKLSGFTADFHSVENTHTLVKLTSGAVWIVIKGENLERVVMVEQADRVLPDGTHPWEVPSGRVDPKRESLPEGDQNIVDTCLEETLEETGLHLPNLRPIAVAVKNPHTGLNEIIPMPRRNKQDIWINEKTFQSDKPLTGGLICLSIIPSWMLLSPITIKLCQSYPSTTIYTPLPKGVNRYEISRIALVPIEKVLDRTAKELNMSAHPWAQEVGLNAFIACAEG